MFEILGIIFVVLIGLTILSLIVIKIVNFFREDDDKFDSLHIEHEITGVEYGWYIIPTVHVHITNWINITFYWLNFGYYITIYTLHTDERIAIDDAYVNVRKEKRDNDKS